MICKAARRVFIHGIKEMGGIPGAQGLTLWGQRGAPAEEPRVAEAGD